MATVCLLVKGKLVPLDVGHGQFEQFLSTARAVLGFQCTKFQYKDEDGDTIRIDSSYDFQEAMKYALTGKTVVLEPAQGEEVQFLEAIPMASSTLFSESGSIARDPPSAVLVSEFLEEAKSVSIETIPIEKAEKEVSPPLVVMKEEGSMAAVERGEFGTNMDQHAVSCETQPFETNDRSTNVPPVPTVNIATGREYPVSIASETAEIPILDQFTGTDPMVHVSSSTPPIDQCESSCQCDELPPPSLPMLDPTIIKSLIQEEMKALFPAKRSILRSRVSMNSVHQGYACALCRMAPIRGARFRCTQCVEFDLCEDCEDANEHEHVLLKIRIPLPVPQPVPQPVRKPEEVKAPAFNSFEVLRDERAIRPSRSKELSAQELKLQNDISAIQEMGFTREQAISALNSASNNLEDAINRLLS